MIFHDSIDQQLLAEVTRVGGGYLRLDFSGAEETCKLLVHEGTELEGAGDGTVAWRAWDGCRFQKEELLPLLEAWPTYSGRPLDGRVGIWFERFRRQRNRKTKAVRWKDLAIGIAYYPDNLPWHDLQRLEDHSAQ